jgi:hypothetical protein
MTRAEALAELKNYIRETTYDAAWGDSLLISYMSEGQDKFCEGTGYFQDYINHTITLVEDQVRYAIPDRTIQVLDIFNGTRRLGKFREEDRGMRDLTWDPSEPINRSGAPLAWQDDRTTGYIILDGTPTANDAGTELTVGVWRYSTYALTNDDIDGEGTPAPIEIPLQFHRAIIEYAAFKALMSHDMEQQDKVKAQDHYAMFREYVRDGKRAMQRYHGLETRVGTDQSYVW